MTNIPEWPSFPFPPHEIELPSGASGPEERFRADTPKSESILAVIQERGFVTAGELQKIVGLGWGTLHYHLHRHLRAKRLESRIHERRRIYYLPGKAPDSLVVAAKRSIKLQRLLLELVSRNAPSQAELIANSNVSQRMASYYLQKLERWGMIERRSVGNRAQYLPTPSLLAAMLEVSAAPAPAPAKEPQAPSDPPNAVQRP